MESIAHMRGLSAAWVGVGALANPVLALQRAHAARGDVIALTLPSLNRRARRTYLIADPMIARAVLQDARQFENVALYPIRGPRDSAQRRLRYGIIRLNGPRHDRMRADISPFLSRKAVVALEPRIRQIAADEAASWPLGESVDLVALVNRMTRRIAFEVLFGETDPGPGLAMSEEGARHLEMSRDLAALGFPLDLPFTPYGRLLRRAERVESILLGWIDRRRRGPAGNDLMSMVLAWKDEDGAPIGDTDAAAQLWTLYGASYDTTSSTLAWLLLLLAQSPAAAQTLHAELEAAEGGEAPAYLQHVIKEAMRLCTPVPLQIRRVAEDGELPGAALKVRRGDHVILSDIVINRSQRQFGDPLAFRPDRWADPALPDAAALTFSAGPRGCIGTWFAMAALSAAVSAIWSRVRIKVDDGARIGVRTLITMNPVRIPATLHAQDGAFTSARIVGDAAHMAQALSGATPTAATAYVAPIARPVLAPT